MIAVIEVPVAFAKELNPIDKKHVFLNIKISFKAS